MKQLHKAALKRAYRTFAQGMGGSTVATALAALGASIFADEATRTVALVAAASSATTTVVASVTSFWQGVAQGLPEAEPGPETTLDALIAYAAPRGIDVSSASTDQQALRAIITAESVARIE